MDSRICGKAADPAVEFLTASSEDVMASRFPGAFSVPDVDDDDGFLSAEEGAAVDDDVDDDEAEPGKTRNQSISQTIKVTRTALFINFGGILISSYFCCNIT